MKSQTPYTDYGLENILDIDLPNADWAKLMDFFNDCDYYIEEQPTKEDAKIFNSNPRFLANLPPRTNLPPLSVNTFRRPRHQLHQYSSSTNGYRRNHY